MSDGVQDVAASKPWDEAMSGWRSHFVAAEEQLSIQRAVLLALVGQRLTAGWTGWDPERDQYLPNIPLVLVFHSGVQFEIGWQSWDALSITWNTIDLSVPPEGIRRPYEWRSSRPDPVAAIAGKTLAGFATLETPYFPGEADLSGELPMHAVAGWKISGLWIDFGGVGLHVYNAYYNGLASQPVQRLYENATRITPWPSSS